MGEYIDVGNNTAIIGVFVIARHGDFQASYLSPTTYDMTSKKITPLGETQSFNLGALMQSRYLRRSSSLALSGVNETVYVDGQSLVKADMGDEASITFASALAVSQGLWPATTNATITDGTNTTAPLGGYQYVPITSVDPNHDLYLEGYTACNARDAEVTQQFGTPDFLTAAQINEPFLESLQAYVGGRPTALSNIYDAYNYLSINDAHNNTFHQLLPPGLIAQTRQVADWEQYNLYSSTDPTNILNIGGQTLLAEIINILGRLSNKSDPLKLVYYSASYKPLISLFAMTNVTTIHPELAGIANFAGAVALEVRQPLNSTDLLVRFNFKNGTADPDFKPYPMFGRQDGDYDVPLSEFEAAFKPYVVPDTFSWCMACNNSIDRGCDVAVQAAMVQGLLSDLLDPPHHSGGVSPATAGVIGAVVALIVAGIFVALLLLMGFLSVGNRRPSSSGHHRRSSSIPQIVVRFAKGKRDSGDSDSTRGVVKDPGNFEMMPDVDNLSTLSPFEMSVTVLPGNNSSVLGVVIVARHGDIQADYNTANSYATTSSKITALGESQSFNLGALLQSRYLTRSSPVALLGINPEIYVDGQSVIKADMGENGNVIFSSALAVTQGLWPATQTNSTLPDGSSVLGPLNGYQYVPVRTVDPNNDLYLEGYTSCNTYNDAANAQYGTTDFIGTAEANAAFLESLQPYVGGRPTTFGNIYSAYEYLSINDVHNGTYNQSLPPQFLAQARALANWQQYRLFSSPDPTNILNIGGRTLLAEILTAVNQIENRSDPLRLAFYSMSYEPLLSLFAMLGVTQVHPELAGIVNYAGAVALEIRQPYDGTELFVRFNFKNGSSDPDFKPYPMLGRQDGDYDISLDVFQNSVSMYAVPDTLSWCIMCNNSIDRGCDVTTQAALAGTLLTDLLKQQHHDRITPAIGGVIGALVTLTVAALLLIFLVLLGVLNWKPVRRPTSPTHHRRNSSIPQMVVRMAKGKRESDDTESTRGVIKNPGDFEMMPDVDGLSTLSRAPSHVDRTPMKV
ncbi:hypothetical protein FRB99_001463 [Tulasnella sp. 403]|nr:hypothetical protein FRB99_001463 [Tulasnella sp. 403]